MKAELKNYRQSPRKVRLVANLVKGLSISQALTELDFLAKRAALPLQKLVKSAVANAVKNDGQNEANIENSLIIKNITVDKGITLKRFMPVSRGSAHPIHKHTSRVTVTLATTGSKTLKNKK
ncbi:50S ribosomal protein L22 [Candidatus Nomurabacteria bacterium RIFCSPHIGHO2_02_FULL_38_15]|uniref:Large ribosomal subunit protein uL22 n=1 Tax=Candidatus Nomurabacteria bacterium RIFCSPHIGHO2_02_FULL_38_15 TaxID=1801752 RepID=A0A1F6VQW2_9BACT|nr:MAG: 50S ribosomal protein L22 [Candidatus Nomurabacteria bacterium RIFCSPHIGHO2_02_FULL_38_15]